MITKFHNSIKLKLLIAMFIVLFLIIALAFFSVRMIELNSAKMLQNKEAEQQADIVLNTLDAYNESMKDTAQSWGLSVSSYDYINGINPDFETNFLTIDTFETVDINLVIFYDTSGGIHYQKIFNFDTQLSANPSLNVLEQMRETGVYENTLNDSFVKGYIDVDGLVYYIVSAPITNEDKTDMVGNLLFGRLIDSKELNYVRSIVNVDFTMSQSSLEVDQVQSIDYISGNELVIKREFDDMLTDEHIMITITMDAEIIDIVDKAMIQYSFVILALGLSFAIITGYIFNFIVFQRLRRLSDEINNISLSGNFSSRTFHEENYDEISVISREVNFMLDKINEDEKIIYQLAYTDHLTKMPNRLQFVQLADSLIVESIVRSEMFAIFFMDLDNFKIVNDTYGHHSGDKLIVRFAQILEHVCEKAAMISRIGGDEFLILATYKNEEQLVKMAESILSIFSQAIQVDDLDLILTASVGIAKYPMDATEVEDLIEKADQAMYEAKNLGKNSYQFYKSK